jgi:hypothetical protein
MRTAFNRARAYLTDSIVDPDGVSLPISRIDIALCVLQAAAIMVITAECFEPAAHRSVVKVLCSAAVAVLGYLLSSNRRLTTGAALAIVSMRLWIGLISVHSPTLIMLATAFSVISLICLWIFLCNNLGRILCGRFYTTGSCEEIGRRIKVATVVLRDADRGRDAYCYAPPAQNRTCGFPAYGFHLGYLTAKR